MYFEDALHSGEESNKCDHTLVLVETMSACAISQMRICTLDKAGQGLQKLKKKVDL